MNDVRTTLQESWGRAILAASSSLEEQTQQLVVRLKESAGVGAEGARQLAELVSSKLQGYRQQVQQQVEEAVRRGISRVKPLPPEELHKLSDKLDRLERELERLERLRKE